MPRKTKRLTDCTVEDCQTLLEFFRSEIYKEYEQFLEGKKADLESAVYDAQGDERLLLLGGMRLINWQLSLPTRVVGKFKLTANSKLKGSVSNE